MPSIGFLHTSPVHVATFDALTHQTWPLVSTLHVVDEPMLVQARENGAASVQDRVRMRIEQLIGNGAEVVVCTCSTIGGVAEQAAQEVATFRVDRPMAQEAARIAGRIGVLAALESTLEPTRSLLLEEIAASGRTASIELVIAEDAWAHFEAGDTQSYVSRLVDAATDLAERSDVIVLAQASMAPAEPYLQQLGVPVLSSPGLAVQHAVQRLTDASSATRK